MSANLRTAIALKKAIDTVDKNSKCIGFNVMAGTHVEEETEKVYWNLAIDLKVCIGCASNDDDDDDDEDDEDRESDYPDDVLVPLVNKSDGKLIPSTVSHYAEIHKALCACASMRSAEFIKHDLGAVGAHISVGATGAPLPTEGPDLQTLYDSLPDGVHGDLDTLTTVQDKDVRNARDMTSDKFAVAPAMLDAINAAWRESGLCPADVEIVPYKVNIYPKGGKFETHVDTPPAANFVGTVVVCMSDRALIEIDDEAVRFARGEMVAFFGDTPHRVPEVTTDAMRVTATFNVMARGPNTEASMDRRILRETTRLLTPILDKYTGFGIMLDHGYSSETDTAALKGMDAYIVAVFEEYARAHPTVRVKNAAVVEKVHFEKDDRRNPLTTKVYLITDAYLAAMTGDRCSGSKTDRVYDPDFESIVPIAAPDAEPSAKRARLGEEGRDPRMAPGMVRFFPNIPCWDHEWERHEIPPADYTGNESRPLEINSIYIAKAVIVL